MQLYYRFKGKTKKLCKVKDLQEAIYKAVNHALENRYIKDSYYVRISGDLEESGEYHLDVGSHHHFYEVKK